MFIDPRHGQPAARHHHDPRAFAWELMSGFPPSRNGRPRKPHRGELPDVDFPAPPPRPRFAVRVAALIRRLFVRSRAADTVVSAADDAPVGEWIDPSYVRAIEAWRVHYESGPKPKRIEDLAA
jgi:hypothetical protein